MLLLRIDESAPTPKYRQVIDGIVRLVDDATLKPGDRLPSTRVLARRLGLNRFTLYRAYQELQALGYVDSRPGSYTTVRQRSRIAPEGAGESGAIDWARISSAPARRAFAEHDRLNADHVARAEAAGAVDFTRLDVDGRLSPVKDFQRASNHVLAAAGTQVLRYGPPQGYEPLREYIAARLRVHGVAASPRNILVTNGSSQAIDLVCRLFAAPGARAAVESPTYSIALPNLRFHGYAVDGVPMREDGLDLRAFERLARAKRPAFLYTVPNFHNPTGITTSQEHRERLLAICEREGIPILEDGFEEEMKYFGKAVLPIKSMDARQVVIYAGTFSKVLFPGIRIGWITAHEDCVARLTALRRFADLSPSHVTQAILDRFCRDGYYDLHLKRLHRVFRRRMETALAELDRGMPRGVSWTRPSGGYTIWIGLPRPVGDEALREAMREHGVYCSLGRFFFTRAAGNEYLRLSISTLDEDEIREGISRLGRMLGALARKRGVTHAA